MNNVPHVLLGLAYQLVAQTDLSLIDALTKVRTDLSELEGSISDVIKEEEKTLTEREQREKSVLGMIVMIDKAEAWTPCDCPVAISLAVAHFIENKCELGQTMKVDGTEMKIIYPSNNSTYGKAPVRIQQNHLPT